MVRRMKVMVFFLFAATILCGVPQRSLGKDGAEKNDKKDVEQTQSKQDAKDTTKDEDFRDSVNRAFDEFKTETAKGKKNLNDLYEREKSKSSEGNKK